LQQQLRSSIADVPGGDFSLGQRLERMVTIRDKLVRQPGMALSRMQDIGGCRAVLLTQADVDAAVEHLRQRHALELLAREAGYVAEPKSDGYRAKHVIGRSGGVLIEIQLRTELQHRWAELVEQFDRRRGTDLKTGRGSEEAAALMRRAAEVFADLDMGRIEAGRTDIVQFMKRLAGDGHPLAG